MPRIFVGIVNNGRTGRLEAIERDTKDGSSGGVFDGLLDQLARRPGGGDHDHQGIGQPRQYLWFRNSGSRWRVDNHIGRGYSWSSTPHDTSARLPITVPATTIAVCSLLQTTVAIRRKNSRSQESLIPQLKQNESQKATSVPFRLLPLIEIAA